VLAEISPEFFASLHNALQIASPSLETSELGAQIAKEVPGVSSGDIESILDAVASLYTLRDFFGYDPNTLAEELSEIIREDEAFEEYSASARDELIARIRKLLSRGGVLEVVAKAKDLTTTHAKTFVSARIVSDLRPIFADDVTQEPSAISIVHTLKLVYHEGLQHNEFFVALRAADVDNLKKLLDRTVTKSQTLHAMAARFDKPCLEL